MYNETTRLVKVVMPDNAGDGIVSGDSPLLASATTTDSDAIMLSDTAENLFIAYEVVAMVKDESTGKTHFSQLKWKKLGTVEDESESESESESEETESQFYYQFMFESGDLFVAAAADEYPALDGDELQMLNDSSSGGGSGGGVMIVHESYDSQTNTLTNTFVLDKTWQEIYDAMANGIVEIQGENPPSIAMILNAAYDTKAGSYDVYLAEIGWYTTSSADGYPSREG